MKNQKDKEITKELWENYNESKEDRYIEGFNDSLSFQPDNLSDTSNFSTIDSVAKKEAKSFTNLENEFKKQNNVIFNKKKEIEIKIHNLIISLNNLNRNSFYFDDNQAKEREDYFSKIQNYKIDNCIKYGSEYSGDFFFESDQDFLIIIYPNCQDNNESYKEYLETIRLLLEKNRCKDFNPIKEVTQLIGDTKNFIFNSIKVVYKFWGNDKKYKIDLNFQRYNYDLRYKIFEIFNLQNLKLNFYMNHPNMKTIMKILKFYFINENLMNTYEGGMNNTCLFLVFYTFCCSSDLRGKTNSLIFMDFLEFFVNFDYKNKKIDFTDKSLIKNKNYNDRDLFIIHLFNKKKNVVSKRVNLNRIIDKIKNIQSGILNKVDIENETNFENIILEFIERM